MAGMTTTGIANVVDYNNRPVTIEVTGLCRQSVMKTSHYRVKVSYGRLSQTIQSIARMGGKVASVTVGAGEPVRATAASPKQPAKQPAKQSAKQTTK